MAFKMYYHIGTGEERERTSHWTGGSEFKTVCGRWVRDFNVVSAKLTTTAGVDCPHCLKKAEEV